MSKKYLENTPHFNAQQHSYVDRDGFKYKSVTNWVDSFKPVFDKIKIAEKIAKKNSVPVETVLQEWEEKRDNSAFFGSKIHKALETFSTTGLIEDKDCKVVIENLQKANILFDKKDCLFEQIVSDREIGIAGTADVIHLSKDNTFSVYDFKTNKKLRFQSAFGNENLLKPFNHLPNSEYWLYSLQLSMYGYIFSRMSGLKLDRLKIHWYNREEPENYKNFNGKWITLDLPYLQTDINSWLNESKN